MRNKDTHLIWEIFTSNKEIPPILTLSAQPHRMSEDPDEYWHKKRRKHTPKFKDPIDRSKDLPGKPKVIEIEGNTETSATSGKAYPYPNAWDRGGINEDGDQPYRKTDVDILDDIRELPSNYVKGMGLIKDLEKLEALPSGKHWSIGAERREIIQRIENDLGSGLDRYYGQKEQGGGLVPKTIPGSSVYMDADTKTRRIQPSETGRRAFALLFAHRKAILDDWTHNNELDR